VNEPNFAINFVGDGYSTSKKIMGRQSAGKSLIRGMARKWQNSIINGFGTGAANDLVKQLKSEGFLSKVRWFNEQTTTPPQGLNAVYYPAPPSKALAYRRNRLGPSSYSIFGVTHTLSSSGAMDQISELILPPFKPWDAIICTSSAALGVVNNLHDEAREWWTHALGASRFNAIQKFVIPLGINAPDFEVRPDHRSSVRMKLGLEESDICFLFAGRMTFHAKANPVAFYQAIEAACQSLNLRLVCVEAGIYPNEGTQKAFEEARALIAPSAKFVHVNGADKDAYDGAWAAADVFVSLSDNIQETFGITPLEAMAAGLPVIVSDWNGYKDTVRDGVDGFRIPVIWPTAGSGRDLALRHDEGSDSYDYYIGRVSMTTVIDVGVLTKRMIDLAQSESLRRLLGETGRQRVRTHFDWPVILDQYTNLASELEAIRKQAGYSQDILGRPNRPDPFSLFSHYPTSVVTGDLTVTLNADLAAHLDAYLDLGMLGYVIDPAVLPKDAIREIVASLAPGATVSHLMAVCPTIDDGIKIRAIMWLAKMGMLILGNRIGAQET
jgi:glycosyltransferase involved in cell wall biosynthesis